MYVPKGNIYKKAITLDLYFPQQKNSGKTKPFFIIGTNFDETSMV